MINSPNTILNKLSKHKESGYQSQIIKLTSPLIHIGGSDSELNPFDYIQRENKLIYFPNQNALITALSQHGELDNYIDLIKEYRQERNDFNLNKNHENILRLLREVFGEKWWTARSIDNTSIFPSTSISHRWTDQDIKKIKPFIRNGFAELYIPGTSIKGAIRTAIAYYLLKHQLEQKKLSDIERNLIQIKPHYLKKKKAFLDDEKLIILANNQELSLNSYLFSNFRIKHEYRLEKEINISNTDFMRAIKISDSSILIRNQNTNLSIVSEIISSSFYKDGRISKYSGGNSYSTFTFVEMVWKLETDFILTIDTDLLSHFQHDQGIELPPKLLSIQGILEICEEFAQAQWEHEKKYWNSLTDDPNDEKLNFSRIRNFYNNNCSYNLRLGWGTGMTGTTIGLHFQESTREHIRNACGISTNSSETPKSRRTAIIPTKQNLTKKALGWVQLTPMEVV